MKRLNNRWITMLTLVLAGESIYMLVFLRKTFQTSMEQVFNLTGTEVVTLNSMFGILALVSYFPGGWVADQFSTRRLLSLSLIVTGLGGLYMLTQPSYTELLVLNAVWGISTIFTFWAPLVKATRGWGSAKEQGRSFGLLDGGRGLVGAVLATFAATVFDQYGVTTRESLMAVIWIYSIANFISALAIWLILPDDKEETRRAHKKKQQDSGETVFSVLSVLRMPAVWFLTGVIFCSYFLYLGTFDFPAFAERGYDQSKEFGAYLGSFRDWMRPIAAIGAGFIADRVGSSKVLISSFSLAVIGFGSMAMLPTYVGPISLLFIQVAVASAAAFALRGIYYALLEEGNIPKISTGTVVGFASFMGYTPEIFGHYLSGWFVDTFPGSLGYHYYFGFLTAVSITGVVTTYCLCLYEKRTEEEQLQSEGAGSLESAS